MTLTYSEAIDIAIKYHGGQIRKFSGLAYVTHPLTVASKFIDEDYKIIAVLHDTIEDTDLTFEKLAELGMSSSQIYILGLLTHEPNESYLDYIKMIVPVKIAREIKIADIEHNLSDLRDGCLKDKYQLALHILKK